MNLSDKFQRVNFFYMEPKRIILSIERAASRLICFNERRQNKIDTQFFLSFFFFFVIFFFIMLTEKIFEKIVFRKTLEIPFCHLCHRSVLRHSRKAFEHICQRQASMYVLFIDEEGIKFLLAIHAAWMLHLFNNQSVKGWFNFNKVNRFHDVLKKPTSK